ncbi:hypothetical protein [Anaerostipes sp. Marseille-Q3525]|uniref:hypothetical protein n=1 Tax=Anaerostipes sp. Marseille-Q3525 TaxID=2758418 RepID=UPI001BABEDB9|nr:hypothetical protein [Anaerostipes sp. Marseille-Q3525]MBR9961383.1 hypothetical protein [Anaerostipes sp. Marseille-Q3525]
MAFFDYDRNGKKDWKDNAREYYLYNKLKEDDASKHNREKEECFLFMFCMMWFAMMIDSLCK